MRETVETPVAARCPDRFKGRRILITGASRGIAAAMARALAAEGAAVAVNYSAVADAVASKAQAAETLVAEIVAAGGRAMAIETDLTRDNSGHTLVEKAIDALGSVDGLVLSASVQRHVPFLLQSREDLNIQMRVNLYANIEILQSAIPPMVAAGFGRILTIGSIQEVVPSAEMPIYAMTKAGLKNLVENLAVQTAPHGITVNNLAPGLIQTDRNEHRRADIEQWQRLARSANPLGRAGTPEDLVGAALQLLSAEASFITGATLYATGGAHIPVARADSHGSDLVLPPVSPSASRAGGTG